MNDPVTLLARVLLLVGGLNWGVIGAFETNLVDEVLGAGSTAGRVVYVLVGLAAVYLLAMMLMKPNKAEA